jgi:hypothetical protein
MKLNQLVAAHTETIKALITIATMVDKLARNLPDDKADLKAELATDLKTAQQQLSQIIAALTDGLK